MVFYCAAYGCNNVYKKGLNQKKFFRFPSEPRRCKTWVAAVKRLHFYPNENSRICSDHFIEGKPNITITHPDYVPSIFCFKKTKKSHKVNIDRYYRALARRERKEAMECVTQLQADKAADKSHLLGVQAMDVDDVARLSPVPIINEDSDMQSTDGTLTTTHPDEVAVSHLDDIKAEAEKLRVENSSLKRALLISDNRLQRSIDVNSELRKENLEVKIEVTTLSKQLANRVFDSKHLSDKNCRFYTGVRTVAIFTWIVSMVADVLPKLHSVSYQDQVLMVLMKFRLGLLDEDIAHRFNISTATVSKVMKHVIPALATRLKFLIKWPTKVAIRRTLPKCFRKKFKKCRVVIDCSEIFIQRPRNLNTRAKTYSNYKHHNTLKFLVGITPYGSVSFVSKCWGGRISDKELCARSGFYDIIEPGDLIMADRGFTIADELGFRGARLAIPAFTKRRNQLPGRLVNSGRILSRARIHVERLIGQIKKFRILQGTLNHKQVKIASDIVSICCSLVNLNKSQVS